MSPLVVLACGGRDYHVDEPQTSGLYALLSELLAERGAMVLIEGAAPGADAVAGLFAFHHQPLFTPDGNTVIHERYPAEWDVYGKRAGFIRNRQMRDRLLYLKDHGYDVLCLAAPGGKGTDMMVTLCEQVSLPVERVS